MLRSEIFVLVLAWLGLVVGEMPTHKFKNGDEMPLLGLGTWKSEPDEVKTAVKEAIKLGYRHIDCAAIYGNEKEVGEALAESFNEGIVKREDMWITSKVWNDSHEQVSTALKKTLADLQLDYVDLYLIHWPISLKNGVSFPQDKHDMFHFDGERTWKAMESTVDMGLARHIGVSNFSTHKLGRILANYRIKPEVNQVERHPYLQQQHLVQFCRMNGILVTNYSSLGSGDRPAAFKPEGEPVLLEDATVKEVAAAVGATPAGVLLKWGIQQGSAVIPKSVNPERLKQNLEVPETVHLDDAAMEKLNAMDIHRRYVDGAFWALAGSAYTVETLWDEVGDPFQEEL
ncbi:Deoxymugineic acid synthase 1 [Seminavis robusta]|uniref:Deoxymugineic acid synthase 1 n=1 Tax=Seminavis robusta TaxID=568900 RepID=A0A9N8F1V1_9STRA|nr:Deoxymugineic acid synthase 1 [Seminavis robusta]|eukprot:Sro2332_g323640.1 Deoxymugineic acid synthase 1 (343) ;mRNA; r:9169-10336